MKILLNDIKRVQEFCNLASGLLSDVDVVSGRYCVSGKSLMGLFSLSLDQPVEIRVYEVVPSEKVQFEAQLKNLGWTVD